MEALSELFNKLSHFLYANPSYILWFITGVFIIIAIDDFIGRRWRKPLSKHQFLYNILGEKVYRLVRGTLCLIFSIALGTATYLYF